MEHGAVISTQPATSQNEPSTITNHDTSPVSPSIKTSRFKWKKFFRLFSPNRKIDAPNEPSQDDMHLQDVTDPLAMAITLPDDMKGKDIRVSIELKTSTSRTSKSSSRSGLNLLEASATKTVYHGNIKVPTNVTVETLSKMPVYFVNGTKTKKSNGVYSHKVETIFQPNEDNMPANVDRDTTVSNVNMKVNIQMLKQNHKMRYKRLKTLNYMFINNEPSNKQNKEENISHGYTSTEYSSKQHKNILKTDITKANCGTSSSKVVTETVSTISEKIRTQDISTQYSVTVTNKEVNARKSQFFESDSLYATDTTNSSTLIAKSGMQQVSNNRNIQPRFYINFDKDLLVSRGVQFPPQPTDYDYISVVPTSGRLSRERREHLFRKDYVLKQNIQDDIDTTLNLLENAKNKLISYLSQPIRLPEFNREYKYNYHSFTTPSTTTDVAGDILRYSAPTCITGFSKAEHDANKWTGGRFFRKTTPPEQDLINISMSESSSTLKLNTIQNIYNTETYIDGDTFTRTLSQTAQDDLLQKRYTGDHEQNELSYNIVVNDIHLMIRDLLEESGNIKKITLSLTSIETTTEDDVKSIISNILERTEDSIETALIEKLDKPKCLQPTMCINYCLMDERIQEDSTNALIDHPNISEMVFPSNGGCKILKTSWSFGQTKRMPTVSIRRLSNNTKRTPMFHEDDLLSKLDRGAVFIQEICNEMYDVDTKLMSSAESILQPEDGEELSESEIDCQMVVNSFETSVFEEDCQTVNRFETCSLEDVTEEYVEEISRVSSDESARMSVIKRKLIGEGGTSCGVRVPKARSPYHIGVSSSSSIMSKYSLSIPDTDYDGDNDEISIEFPNIVHEYNSMQELNNQDEIDYIEKNVESNKKLTTAEGCSQDDK